MAGKTKRKYIGELMRFNKSLKRPLTLIQEVLPYRYCDYDILNFFKEFYPHEWQVIQERYKQYKEKDNHLEKVGKKRRYYPEEPKVYFFNLQKVKNMLSTGKKEQHKKAYDKIISEKLLESLKIKRSNIIKKRDEKILKSKENMQTLDPLFIDIFINEYHRKGISTEGKVEIFKELEKYDAEKSLEFFYKLNDSEKNNQVRQMAFTHLQKVGKYVKLRKNFKGKKKSYMIEESDFFMKPKDLYERINSDSIQNEKKFDYFISHSSIDYELIRKIQKSFNKVNYTTYCDWTSDNDFLKRKYSTIGEYTTLVLKRRIEQSKNIVFVQTENTTDEENNLFSKWIQMELDYAKKLKKNIVCIDLLNNTHCEFQTLEYNIETNSLKI